MRIEESRVQDSSQRLRPKPPARHTLTGNFVVHKDFPSIYLEKDRTIIVYLPPDYERNLRKRYPVLYMHDGQNLFDGATSFIPGVEWRMDETAEELISNGEIEPMIIVGIYNTGESRLDEYTFIKDWRGRGGKADDYAKMIIEELKPFIDAKYRTLRTPEHTGVGGSSLGGLVSLYFGLRYNEVFGKLAILSPSTWWAGKAIVKEVAKIKRKPNQKIWLDVGLKEDMHTMVSPTRLLKYSLIAKGWELDEDLLYFEAPNSGHSESDWAKRVGPMLRFLFPVQMK
ncbi:MAG: alpha/beta hydrolase-fold protein [Chloroherpetonaceae bacterium]|nr:alpha/beta hydrolase-fold protein [Chloroherpetonaceae bacterium]